MDPAEKSRLQYAETSVQAYGWDHLRSHNPCRVLAAARPRKAPRRSLAKLLHPWTPQQTPRNPPRATGRLQNTHDAALQPKCLDSNHGGVYWREPPSPVSLVICDITSATQHVFHDGTTLVHPYSGPTKVTPLRYTVACGIGLLDLVANISSAGGDHAQRGASDKCLDCNHGGVYWREPPSPVSLVIWDITSAKRSLYFRTTAQYSNATVQWPCQENPTVLRA